MMELENITAQIFQRSEEKKKALRAKRRRIAACIVSVGLCACLAVVFAPRLAHKSADAAIVPESVGGTHLPDGEINSENQYSTLQDGQTGNTMPTVILIQNPQKIARLTALLDFAQMVPESPMSDDKAESDPNYSYSTGTVQVNFTWVTDEGKETYCLCNNVVTRMEDMSKKQLSKEELSELYQLLELPAP